MSRPTTRMTGLFAALVFTLALAAPAAVSAAPGHATGVDRPVGAQLATVRAATARFHDVAVAEAAGYEQVSPCIDRPDGAPWVPTGSGPISSTATSTRRHQRRCCTSRPATAASGSSASSS
jgi:hypothetical protein